MPTPMPEPQAWLKCTVPTRSPVAAAAGPLHASASITRHTPSKVRPKRCLMNSPSLVRPTEYGGSSCCSTSAGRAQRPSPDRAGSLDVRALTGLRAGHLVRGTPRVADLRRGRVAGAVQAAVDRVGDVLVAVLVEEHVVVQVYRPVHGVADESEPEAVVAAHRDAAVDPAVLDRVPRDVERSPE